MRFESEEESNARRYTQTNQVSYFPFLLFMSIYSLLNKGEQKVGRGWGGQTHAFTEHDVLSFL